MNFDDSETHQPPSNDAARLRNQNWKTSIIVLAIGFATCIVGAVIASQKDHDIAVVGENVHRAGMVIVFVGLVGFLIGLRAEQISKWLEKKFAHFDDRSEVAAMAKSDGSSRDRASERSVGSRFQFSLAPFFMVTTGFAITGGLFLSVPDELLVVFALLGDLTITIALTMAFIYGRGYAKTFCICGLVAIGSFFFFNANMLGGEVSYARGTRQAGPFLIDYRVLVLGEWAAVFLFGIFGVCVRFVDEWPFGFNVRRH